MAKPLISDDLWTVIEPLLPPERLRPKGGRPPVPHRAALTGIIFVLKSGIPWEMLPREMGCGSGMTPACAGAGCAGAGCAIGTSLASGTGCIASCSTAWAGRRRLTGAVPAWTARLSRQKGGGKTGPNPTDRGRAGSKRYIITDARGVPLALRVTAANIHDSRLFDELIDAVPPVRQGRGRPCRRPDKLHADKAYDVPRCHRDLRKRHIGDRIARRGIESSQRLGRHRWVVERTLAWFSRFRRLTVRYQRRADIFEAFHHLATALICWRFLLRRLC